MQKIIVASLFFLIFIISDTHAFAQSSSNFESIEIPPWVKITAGWWAEDVISETEFLRALEFLIENNIIKISATASSYPLDISKIFTKPEGRVSEFAQFSGTYEEKHDGPLTLTIILPDTSEITLTTVARDGTFTATMELTSDTQMGRYIVYAEIEGEQIPVSAFEVRGSNTSKVPEWIKNNALWWSEDSITDSDFVTGIEFLVVNKIIKVETHAQTIPAKIPEAASKVSECIGDAQCISGRVTEVIDGDTIRVNGQEIRFALASAPEITQPEGLEAQAFIDSLCPIGNIVLVDEDDGQADGSFGRIVAVVYCKGMNLNEELLDANLGFLSAGFCGISEFSQSQWAQKHGCSPDAEHTGKTYPERCDSSYPNVCIPSPPPDLDCEDIEFRNFEVIQPDPHGFDGNYDGIGCEE